MNLLWGVAPLCCSGNLSAAEMAEFAEAELMRLGVLCGGDVFGLVAGTTNNSGATNFMRLITVGENSARSKKKNGKPISRTKTQG
jgi:hypothetical protein